VTGIAVIIGRCIAGCLGAILIYSALFLYKQEEGELENRIEQWWQKIRDLHAHAVSRETAFLKVVADITSKGFTKLFGERLFGPKAIAASMCYSQAAFLLLASILSTYAASGRLYTSREESIAGWAEAVRLGWTLGILSFIFLFLGSLGPFVDRQSQRRFWLSSVIVFTASWPLALAVMFFTSYTYGVFAFAYGLEVLGILTAIMCDFLFIALTRGMLARAAQSNSFTTIVALAIGNACLAALLFLVPFVGALMYHNPVSTNGYPPVMPETKVVAAARFLVFSIAASKFFDALVSLSWLLIAALMLLHRLFWPLIERPVYALSRHRVFSEQKKLVFFSGVALLGLAIPSVGRALENVVKAVHG
jgi:hypothetical protein